MGDQFPHYIEFRHVYKTFDHPVLVDSNFHVDAGETVAIIGRSGVGKSVTLSHMMGFLKPDRGQIVVAHEDITDFPESELRRIRPEDAPSKSCRARSRAVASSVSPPSTWV